jgi:quinol-cytochrome oxidoreductase complex cytochrome b subunit
MNNILKNAAIRLLVPPIAGLLFYGSWAFWANHEYGSNIAYKAACTQGLYSFIITLVFSLCMEALFKALQHVPLRSFWVVITACFSLYITSWSVNYVAGTPNILLTILPGAIISTLYILVYVFTLRKFATEC